MNVGAPNSSYAAALSQWCLHFTNPAVNGAALEYVKYLRARWCSYVASLAGAGQLPSDRRPLAERYRPPKTDFLSPPSMIHWLEGKIGFLDITGSARGIPAIHRILAKLPGCASNAGMCGVAFLLLALVQYA